MALPPKVPEGNSQCFTTGLVSGIDHVCVLLAIARPEIIEVEGELCAQIALSASDCIELSRQLLERLQESAAQVFGDDD